MIDGILNKSEDTWIVKHNKLVHTLVGNHDYRVTLEDSYLDVHPEHIMWLKVFGKEGLKVCFEVETISKGENEFDIMDTDVAKLKACFPDMHEYVQD
jgi:hypothetical protein